MHYTPGPRASSPIAAPKVPEIRGHQRGGRLLTLNPSVSVVGVEESNIPASALQLGPLSAEDELNRATMQPSVARHLQTQARQ